MFMHIIMSDVKLYMYLCTVISVVVCLVETVAFTKNKALASDDAVIP